MAHVDTVGADRARLVLAAIRIINGTLALVVPQFLIGRVQSADPPSPAAVYAFRMFGIRTVLIGRDLVGADGPARAKAVAEAPLIHACDTATATLLTVTRRVRLRNGLPLIAISALNTALAVAARPRTHGGRQA
ncbi:hypothetical protein JCM18899A_45330 [Nocardioides sp. AN3]